MSDWKDIVRAEWRKRHPETADDGAFPLMERTFDTEEIVAAVDTILSGQVTMSTRVSEFERRFAEVVGAPYAVMVNSGSSANLLAVSAAANSARAHHLRAGDEVLVPAVCWSTTVWPLVQCGLVPVFVDVDPRTLNISVDDLARRITDRTRAIMIVHVLGNGCDMSRIRGLAAQHSLLVIEDTCESLGTTSDGKVVGTLGDFGTYSFYYSHHMTTGEGGMVVCHTLEDYDLLRCLRAHGWTRQLSDRERVEASHPDIDPRFLFVNVGYNVRPLDVQAAIGIEQLKRLDAMNAARISNRDAIVADLLAHPEWRDQFRIIDADRGSAPAWFGLALLLNDDRDLREYLAALSAAGVENRPIISGNFCRQPALARIGLSIDPLAYPGAEDVHHRGFFIGVQSTPLPEAKRRSLVERLLRA
jgi:CDP-6-deoxy-D-xylo-4-hexulose-3-dehydrase